MSSLSQKTACRCCGVPLETEGARAIGVCVTCVQQGQSRSWPKPPGYGFNPAEGERLEPPRPE